MSRDNVTEITLSDERPCSVRRLRIFELDAIKPPRTRPFLYTINIGGNDVERVYDVTAWETPPEPTKLTPDRHIEGTVAYWQWFEYEMYWAAVYHEDENMRDIERYCNEVRDYILLNCISQDDINRIVTPQDYAHIYQAALVPQISLLDLEEALDMTFRASFDGGNVLTKIFESGEDDDSGGATYSAVRTWEIQAINDSGMSEDEWSLLPLDERARRICAMKIDDWLGVLTAKKREKEKAGVSF